MDIRSFFGGAAPKGAPKRKAAESVAAAGAGEDPAAAETPPKMRVTDAGARPAAVAAESSTSSTSSSNSNSKSNSGASSSGSAGSPATGRAPPDDAASDAAGPQAESEPEAAGEELKAADSSSSSSKAKAVATAGPVVAAGSNVPYAWLAEAFEQVEATTKRLEIQKILATLYLRVLETHPDDLLPTVYLCTNAVAPAHHGIEIGVGDSVLSKAIVNTTGRTKRGVADKYGELGDLGTVAMQFKSQQKMLFGRKPKPLALVEVFDRVREVANTGSQDAKLKIIEKMLVSCSGSEVKYVVRLLQGKLRIGLAEQTVLIALAHALCDYHYEKQQAKAKASASEDEEVKVGWKPTPEVREAAVNMLKQVNSELPVMDEIISAALTETELGQMWYDVLRDKCRIEAGVPLKPMLAKPTNGVSEVLNRFQDSAFTCEYKYDGERAQIHMTTERGEDGTERPVFKIYSRNSEDNTGKYPDIIADICSCFATEGKNKVTEFILDTESVAYDAEKGKLLPFQVLSTRARKDVEVENVKVKVIVCAFDLLLLNGRSLLETPLVERRALLRSHFHEVEHKFRFATSHDGKELEEIESFLSKAVEDCCEGLMVKAIDGPESFYQPARRSLNWLKLKKDYMEGLADSLDLVPIGAWYGKGKRTGRYGAYLLACYDEENDEFQAITKIGTGFSDEKLEEFSQYYADKVVGERPRNFNSGLEADVWFKPSQVWEVRAADLSISPVHTAAMGKVDESRGIALRFPRFLRIRDDKACDDATNATQVAEMYVNQASVSNSGGGGADSEYF